MGWSINVTDLRSVWTTVSSSDEVFDAAAAAAAAADDDDDVVGRAFLVGEVGGFLWACEGRVSVALTVFALWACRATLYRFGLLELCVACVVVVVTWFAVVRLVPKCQEYSNHYSAIGAFFFNSPWSFDTPWSSGSGTRSHHSPTGARN